MNTVRKGHGAGSRDYEVAAARPHGRDGDAATMRAMLATIGREAGLRGVALRASDRFVTDTDGDLAPDADALVGRIEAAWAATDGDRPRHDHVAQIAAAIAHNATDRSGPVTLSRTAWLLLKSYARTGMPPRREG